MLKVYGGQTVHRISALCRDVVVLPTLAADLLFSGVPTLAYLMVKAKASVARVGAHLRAAAVQSLHSPALSTHSPAFENGYRLVLTSCFTFTVALSAADQGLVTRTTAF